MTDIPLGFKFPFYGREASVSGSLRVVLQTNEGGKNYTRPLNSQAIMPLLGLKDGHHLPDAGLPVRKIGDTLVWVVEKDVAPLLGNYKRKRKFAHRIYGECPYCAKAVPFGRMESHQRARTCVEARKAKDLDMLYGARAEARKNLPALIE